MTIHRLPAPEINLTARPSAAAMLACLKDHRGDDTYILQYIYAQAEDCQYNLLILLDEAKKTLAAQKDHSSRTALTPTAEVVNIWEARAQRRAWKIEGPSR